MKHMMSSEQPEIGAPIYAIIEVCGLVGMTSN